MTIKVEVVMVAGHLNPHDLWLIPSIKCALLAVCLMPLLKDLESDVLLRPDILADHRDYPWISYLYLQGSLPFVYQAESALYLRYQRVVPT